MYYLSMFLTINGLIDLYNVDKQLRNLLREDNAVLFLAGLQSLCISSLLTESIRTECSKFYVTLTVQFYDSMFKNTNTMHFTFTLICIN